MDFDFSFQYFMKISRCRQNEFSSDKPLWADASHKRMQLSYFLPCRTSQNIDRFVDIVGPERVIAGSDCGFGTFAGFGAVDPQIAYAKLGALSEGARLAAAHL
jgi:hypothetical protein